jgi:hypothetical protein
LLRGHGRLTLETAWEHVPGQIADQHHRLRRPSGVPGGIPVTEGPRSLAQDQEPEEAVSVHADTPVTRQASHNRISYPYTTPVDVNLARQPVRLSARN